MQVIWQVSTCSLLLLLKIVIIHKFECSKIYAGENLPSEQTDMKQLGPTKAVLFVLTPVL